MSQQPDLRIDYGRTRAFLTDWLRAEFTRNGFARAVINLSGGLDSALSCYLAAEALGPENVTAIRLPYRTSNPESLEHAQLVIDATRVNALTIDITPMVDPLVAYFPDMDNLRKGNIMARQRMIVLYDQSAALGALAVGTGNKTEIILGYTTIYGDSACALNPLGDLYKTQVRQLSRDMGIPAVIVDKPPSADLWIGQTDEADLGYTYAEVDRLLLLLVDGRRTAEECIEAGFPEAMVRGVIRRIRRNRFKRVIPPVAHLSDRSMGYDLINHPDWGL